MSDSQFFDNHAIVYQITNKRPCLKHSFSQPTYHVEVSQTEKFWLIGMLRAGYPDSNAAENPQCHEKNNLLTECHQNIKGCKKDGLRSREYQKTLKGDDRFIRNMHLPDGFATAIRATN